MDVDKLLKTVLLVFSGILIVSFSLRTVFTSSVRKCARTTSLSTFSSLLHFFSFCEIKNSVYLSCNFSRRIFDNIKIAIAFVEWPWDCSMLILKSTLLISVSFYDCTSISSSCIVSSVFSFCCSSAPNSSSSFSPVSASPFSSFFG